MIHAAIGEDSYTLRFFGGRVGDDSAASTLREEAARFRSLRRFAVGGIPKA